MWLYDWIGPFNVYGGYVLCYDQNLSFLKIAQ